jgi:tRNA dimethylallyltransferase
VESDTRLRNALTQTKNERGIYWLHAALARLDPAGAEKIDPRNFRRTIRALEVIFKTGRRFSEQRGTGKSPHHPITIGLKRAREDLYARVDARIDAMFAAGFVDEVRGLLEAGYPATLPSMSAIGYRECIRVIRGEMTIEEAKVEMRRATRVFVRRQANWFKDSDTGITWFDAGAEHVIDRVETHIRGLINKA